MDEALTVIQIAAKLQRKPRTVQENYVTKMVEQGLLERVEPHPERAADQTYRAARRP